MRLPFRLHRLARTLLLSALLPVTAHALDIRNVAGPDGRTMFELRFYDPADTTDEALRPHWALSDRQKARMVEVMERWAHTLRTPADARVGIIDVYTVDNPTAYASSPPLETGGIVITRLQAALQGREDTVYPPEMSHAEIVLGTFTFDDGQYPPSQQPIGTQGFDLASVAFHELAHGLGVASHIIPGTDGEQHYRTRPFFVPANSLWNSLLRDDHGQPGEPGAPVLCAACDNEPQPGAFDVRQDRGYLTGPHITDVLGDSMPGVPVRMLYPNGSLDDNNMSHLELANSVMSHQYFRNYTSYLEAELAVLQDLGYDIDRRRLFGRSVYGSGLTLDNGHGFHARNAEGTAYLPGSYSTATLGMGLHVYGSHNRITQSADLLTQGAGALGIRVDGRDNHVVVPAGVRVHGLGAYGAGVQFAYGRDHTLVAAGDIQATGDAGVGILVDFGHNAFSTARMVRGSYLLCDGNIDTDPCLAPWRGNRPVPEELAGPLVSRLDITGRVAGRRAAIEASETGLVGDIHVMRGAVIDGDIRSRYHQVDEQGQLRLTRLTLGRLADAQGRATDAADPAFRFHYAHQLSGDNLSLQVAGGVSVLDGQHRLHDVLVAPEATLAGLGRYQIVGTGQAFVNEGRLQPGHRDTPMRIDGDYRQGTTGVLTAVVDGAGAHHGLAVTGTATLDGTLSLHALPDWYASGWQLDRSTLVQASSTVGGFAQTTIDLSSPTLYAHWLPAGAGLRLQRAPDAYARHGHTEAARRAGQALDRIVPHAPAAMQALYRQLDFSAPDGRVVSHTLRQLAPTPYATMAASQQDALRVIGDTLARQQTASAGQAASAGWRGFAVPFASQARRTMADGTAFRHHGHGLLLGVERTMANPAWTVGVHAAVAEQRLRLRDPLIGDGRSSSWQLGVHGRYAPDANQGLYLHAQLQAGAARTRLHRTVSTDAWHGSSQARWTTRTVHAQATAGYQWAWSSRTRIGPVATLDYAWLRQPGMTESGDAATRLALRAQRHDSLRASLGVRAQFGPPAGDTARWQGHLQVTRDQELLGGGLRQRAAFAADPGTVFGTTAALAGRGAWRVQGGLSHDTPRLRLAAHVEAQWATRSQRQVAGQVSVGWRF